MNIIKNVSNKHVQHAAVTPEFSHHSIYMSWWPWREGCEVNLLNRVDSWRRKCDENDKCWLLLKITLFILEKQQQQHAAKTALIIPWWSYLTVESHTNVLNRVVDQLRSLYLIKRCLWVQTENNKTKSNQSETKVMHRYTVKTSLSQAIIKIWEKLLPQIHLRAPSRSFYLFM